MLNCKHATELMSQRMERELRPSQRIGLRFHLMMCDGCRNFSRHVAFLREASRKISQKP